MKCLKLLCMILILDMATVFAMEPAESVPEPMALAQESLYRFPAPLQGVQVYAQGSLFDTEKTRTLMRLLNANPALFLTDMSQEIMASHTSGAVTCLVNAHYMDARSLEHILRHNPVLLRALLYPRSSRYAEDMQPTKLELAAAFDTIFEDEGMSYTQYKVFKQHYTLDMVKKLS